MPTKTRIAAVAWMLLTLGLTAGAQARQNKDRGVQVKSEHLAGKWTSVIDLQVRARNRGPVRGVHDVPCQVELALSKDGKTLSGSFSCTDITGKDLKGTLEGTVPPATATLKLTMKLPGHGCDGKEATFLVLPGTKRGELKLRGYWGQFDCPWNMTKVPPAAEQANRKGKDDKDKKK